MMIGAQSNSVPSIYGQPDWPVVGKVFEIYYVADFVVLVIAA
jgi:hypothetical protein